MLTITSVIIKGFQSHRESSFNLSPGLTVITGPSDAGKTAVIRALRWLAFNEPQGEGFLYTVRNADGSIKDQEEQAEVTVYFDNGVSITKTRRKGKTTYVHSLYPEPWEKAEVPQEIKDTLGLIKQTYGDNFETCLNFAFQLDPPFLLSETGGTGAKVLGKLAGTEVVDKAIGAVNKRTHNTRTELSQAEKQIGQLDVELLEYLEVDEQYSILENLESRFQEIEKFLTTQKTLVEKKNQHEALSDRITSFKAKLEPLQTIPVLSVNIKAVALSEERRQAIDKLHCDFWKAVNDRTNARQTIKKLESVPVLLQRVKDLSAQETKLIALKELQNSYLMLQELIGRYTATITASTEILKLKNRVAAAETSYTTTEHLKGLMGRQSVAKNAKKTLEGRITNLEVTTALKGKINDLQAIIEKRLMLDNLMSAFYVKREEVEAAGERVGILRFEITVANGELQEAWEATGGVCPLCEQPLGGAIN